MPKLPVLNPSEIIAVLLKNGFNIDRIRGSHHILLNEVSGKRAVIPMHKKDLPKGTLHEIIKQSGLNIEDFINI